MFRLITERQSINRIDLGGFWIKATQQGQGPTGKWRYRQAQIPAGPKKGSARPRGWLRTFADQLKAAIRLRLDHFQLAFPFRIDQIPLGSTRQHDGVVRMKPSNRLRVVGFEVARCHLLVHLDFVVVVRSKYQIKPAIARDVVRQYMNDSLGRQQGLGVGRSTHRWRCRLLRHRDTHHPQSHGKNPSTHLSPPRYDNTVR